MSGRETNISFTWQEEQLSECHLILDEQAPSEFLNKVIQEVGRRAKEAMRVEVPFDVLLQKAKIKKDVWWQGSTASGIDVPLGPTGARKVQKLTLGQGMAHHGLIVGRTGSGKTNLMHVIITTLGLVYSPQEMELYLVDFKKGVGFKSYADEQLPHAKVIAIESEREFGLSVLQGLDAEMTRRGEVFRRAGVDSISEYRDKTGERLPRILLVADEFQEFFIENDSINNESSVLIHRLVTQGRGFGMHLLLGTQTLAGPQGLRKGTTDQMAIRIALQCSEADSRMILADDNPAARLLSRPGEAIYNAASGMVEGNNRFQVALFTDEDKTRYLKAIRSMASTQGISSKPVVFEGYESARLDECQPLYECARGKGSIKPGAGADAWVGEPVALRPPLAARFRKQSGSHLLVATTDEMEGLGVASAAMLSLAAQHRETEAQFVIVDFATQDLPWVESLKSLADALPHVFDVVRRRELPELLRGLVEEVETRLSSDARKTCSKYVFILGLHRATDLRLNDDGYADSESSHNLAKLIVEGPEAGFHLIAWTDPRSSIEKTLESKTLREFGMRIAGEMSEENSRRLLDSAAAAKLDKPHRMIFCDQDRPGALEKFRPYALPDEAWLRQFVSAINEREK
ncbi:MAG: FtsK/SpoIIIE domain-containing protein [Armatimonadetes bacterium]|nr:FtsK/SpoIIIE domain-containing protein [Armatimonadota bacterium]